MEHLFHIGKSQSVSTPQLLDQKRSSLQSNVQRREHRYRIYRAADEIESLNMLCDSENLDGRVLYCGETAVGNAALWTFSRIIFGSQMETERFERGPKRRSS